MELARIHYPKVNIAGVLLITLSSSMFLSRFSLLDPDNLDAKEIKMNVPTVANML